MGFNFKKLPLKINSSVMFMSSGHESMYDNITFLCFFLLHSLGLNVLFYIKNEF